MAKRKKNNTLKYTIAIGVLILLAVILLFIYFSEENETNRAMRESGYTTTESDDPFYKKITTGNTLDSFYNDVANNKDSAYEEYYLLKESYSFIEQELYFQNGATSSLNISSDLRNMNTMFNYELSYKDAYLLLEGNSSENYQCEVIVNNNISKQTINNACNQIHIELDTYNQRRTEILQNEKVQEFIRNAPSPVPRSYEE